MGLILCGARVQSAEPPRFQAIHVAANGDVSIRLEVTGGKTYRLETSSTLSSWTQLSTKTANNNLLEFAEPAAAAGSARFYRALEVNPGAGPANDNFASAVELKGSLATARGSNTGATPEIGEQDHSWFDPGKTSVWWKWTAPASGRATVSLIGTHFGTLVAVYSGASVNNLNVIAKNRRFSRLISFDAKAGTSYALAVAGHFDATGDIQLGLQLIPTAPAFAAKAIAGASIFLDESSNPNIPLRVLDFAASGLSWTDRDNGSSDAIESGQVLDYKANGAVSTLVLASHRQNETNTIDYIFAFDTATTGSYEYAIDGVPSGSGRFANFRDTRASLAPPSLHSTVLQTVRTKTSTGTSGQMHFFTFGWTGEFHDSDGQEHGSGTSVYSATGATATSKLSYTSPVELAGDAYDVQLKFVTATHGTYSSEYRRNDGAVIQIEGNFVLEFFQ
jgi:hypothetical protein